VQVVVPSLGAVPAVAVAPVVVAAPVVATVTPRVAAEIQAPQPGDLVGRSFVVQVLAPGADRVDVFLEPDRDDGGHLVGTATSLRPQTMPFLATVSASAGMHTMYVHVHSPTAAREEVLTVQVTVS
jgi:hypothetical protein